MSRSNDEIPAQIAELLTRVEMIKEVTDRTSTKVDNIERQSTRAEVDIHAAHKRLNAVEPKLQDLYDLKHKSQGVIMVLGLIFGIIGSFMTHYFKEGS